MCSVLGLRIVKQKSSSWISADIKSDVVLGGHYLLRGNVIYQGITIVLG